MAKLFFRYGTMNSGKTTNLIQVAYNYEERGMKVCILKPSQDTKGNDHITSRINISRKVDKLIGEKDNILDIDFKNISCILVDEAQFLKKEQVDQLMEIVVFKDIPVICYGLRTDNRGEAFEGSARLLAIAHKLEELKTICRCGRKAIFNLRKVDGVPEFGGNQVCIDDQKSIEYEAMCGKCYLELKKEYEKTNSLKK